MVAIFSSPVSILAFFLFLVIVVLYIYAPIDIIPDTSIFGMIDDVGIVCGFIVWVVEQFLSGYRNNVNADFQNIRAN